jgi:periplasmic divalent cation tolerance protein
MGKPVLILTTTPSEEMAGSIARTLVREGLAACANILPGMRSIYRWKDEIHDEPECLVFIKTNEDLFPDIERCIKRLHSYEVPEIVTMPLTGGSEDYLLWLRENLKK